MLFHLLHMEWYCANSIILCQIIAFHLEIYLLLSCSIVITDVGLQLVNVSPLPVRVLERPYRREGFWSLCAAAWLAPAVYEDQ